jgi:ADP-ribose pyrophosphatase
MSKIQSIEVLEDYSARARLDEGFLRLKRLRARNRHTDGTSSREYAIDVIDRVTLDAVALVVWARTARGVEVLTRHQLRPAAFFRRGRTAALPEPEYLLVEEVVAGVLEPGELGLEALRHRAADEAREEAGLDVDPAAIRPLGGPFFPLPGIVSEKIHLFETEVRRGPGPDIFDAPHEGDGSPLEEGSHLQWRTLEEAIRASDAGRIEDCKTELGFRRLAARLGSAVPRP